MKLFLPSFLSVIVVVGFAHVTNAEEADDGEIGSGYGSSSVYGAYRPVSGNYNHGTSSIGGYRKKECCAFEEIEGTLTCKDARAAESSSKSKEAFTGITTCTLEIDDDSGDQWPADCFDWDEAALVQVVHGDSDDERIITIEFQGSNLGTIQAVGSGDDSEFKLGVGGGTDECIGAKGSITMEVSDPTRKLQFEPASPIATTRPSMDFEVELSGKICCTTQIVSY